jgi:hypothetical protein
MSGLEIIVTMAPVSGMMLLSSIGYYLNNKRKYKDEKKKIYKYVKDAISALDFDDIVKGFEMLKDFDIRHSDADGKPNRKYFEKITLKKRLSKSEKTDILFGIPSQIVDDINQIKRHFSDKMKTDNLKVHLEKVEEEEKKENETLVQLKHKLEKIKVRQLASNNSNRKIIDDMNLTDIIKDLHEEYENLFVQTFEQEQDLHNILQRQVKKQMIIKKMDMLSNKKKTQNLKSC